MSDPTVPAEQSPDPAAWAGERVTRWIARADQLDREFAPVSERLFAAAGIRAGETVLDVGCGSGPTTRRAAELAGRDGSVTGLDVSAQMIDAARAVPAEPSPTWLVADPVDWQAPAARFDLVMSRFGVMFFSDPATALTTLASATKPGGRLTVAVWGHRDEVAMFDVPYRCVLDVLTERGAPAVEAPPDGGPFGWHNPDTVTELLSGAGWHDVTVTPHTFDVRFGGGMSPQEAAELAVDHGPTRGLLTDADEAAKASARAALVPVLAQHVDDSGQVVLGASIRIVTARR